MLFPFSDSCTGHDGLYRAEKGGGVRRHRQGAFQTNVPDGATMRPA
jgi:hypothetical protein